MGGRLLIANQLGQSIIMLGQSETGSTSQIILIYNLLETLQCPVPVSANCAKVAGIPAKTILLSQIGMFGLFFIHF
jgi:hypothetical protein